MKLDENKHDHKLTNWLKVGIFALLMLAPIFASISQTLYVTFNKNAYQSYSNQYVEQQVNINNADGLIENQNYIINYQHYDTTDYNYIPYIQYNSISINWADYTSSDVSLVNRFRVRTNDNLIQLKDTNDRIINLANVWGNTLKTFTFNYNSKENNSSTQFYNLSIIGIYYNTEKLDNAFYYGVEQMTKSDLFNWTQNTALYTGINAMTTQLEIQTQAIAILLTYWFILTIIYVIIDIVLKGFTLLTHMFSNKV